MGSKKLRPISASQDVLWQMSQKWAPFCSTKLRLARKWGSKVLISIWDQNILKFFYPKKLNWVMFWFMLARKKIFCYIKSPPNMLLQWLGFRWSTLYLDHVYTINVQIELLYCAMDRNSPISACSFIQVKCFWPRAQFQP